MYYVGRDDLEFLILLCFSPHWNLDRRGLGGVVLGWDLGLCARQAKPTKSTFPALYLFPRSTTPKFSKIGRERGKKSQLFEKSYNMTHAKWIFRYVNTATDHSEPLDACRKVSEVRQERRCKHSESAKGTKRASGIQVPSYSTHVSSPTTPVGQTETVKEITCCCWLETAFHLSWKTDGPFLKAVLKLAMTLSIHS